MRTTLRFIGDLYTESKKDSLLRHSAAVSYYAVFSLPAFLLVLFSIVRTLLQRASVERDILEPVRQYMGEGTANLLEEASRTLREQSVHNGWSATIGGILLLVAAIGLIRELQASLNEILRLEDEKLSILQMLLRYITAIVPLALIACILTFSLLVSAVLGIAEARLSSVMQLPVNILQVGNYTLIILALTAIFTVLYSVLPAKCYRFTLVLPCAFFAALCLFFGSIVVSAIAIFNSIGSIYGVAANLLVLMFWMFFCGNVFFMGAECIDILHKKNIVN